MPAAAAPARRRVGGGRRWLAPLALLWLGLWHTPDSAGAAAPSPIPAAQQRGVEQTFLTYPEWYLVHSPAEYASWVAHDPSHSFPFAGEIGQLWGGYRHVTAEQIRGHYPANPGYHVMIAVIAGSTTVEYGLRWAYENTVGRVSWALSSGRLTAEDRYGAMVAQQYVDFIRQEPWYLFDFAGKLTGLWRDTPASGPDPLRKWERRFALTTEYLIKAAYGKLIGLATGVAYEPARMSTQVVVDRAPSVLPAQVRLVRTLPDGRAILDLPRYYNFRVAAAALADAGSTLVDIAGNTSVILVTVWARDDHVAALGAGNRVLFTQPVLTVPGTRRLALVVPVPQLSAFLLRAHASGAKVEHVYDY
jgi:hypothetical protein